MPSQARPFAIVTGASSGIGFELAKLCVARGYDLLMAADEPEIERAAANLGSTGATVEAVVADLAATEGVDQLHAAIRNPPVAALLANAGRRLGHAFLDQDFQQIRHVIDTNVTGTLYLLHKVGRDMRGRGEGRILITGSSAGFMPGTYQAVYNGTKALLDSFFVRAARRARALWGDRHLSDARATVTDFFERADMLDTKVGAARKQPPSEVAGVGFEAMLKGDGDVVAGWSNKLRAAIAHIVPSSVLAEQHREMAAPGTASEA